MDPDRWREVERLYHAALARPSAERGAFLAQACSDDEALRREVAELLETPPTADGLFAAPAAAAVGSMAADPERPMLTGRRLGVYQLQERIGAGGMGDVYRARDTQLGRDVAIKVLPRGLTDDSDRLARFAREARVLAALNHPNIAIIHGVEESDGIKALVMELVEGPTLAERLSQARPAGLPVNEALAIARQITEALEAAHEKGIIHRDLKPANIKITPADNIKLLDFGIARVASEEAAADLTQAPTVTRDGTREGLIVGTVAYMSPEQARGQAVDKRTDIWAFGCVLYEMVTGRHAFAAATVSDTIAAILQREPDWQPLPENVPPGIRGLLRRCLTKNARERQRDIGDARIELEETLARATQSGEPTSHGREIHAATRWRTAILVAVAVMVGAAAVSVGVWMRFRNGPPAGALPVVRFSLRLGEVRPVISPNGRHLAYRSDGRLWVRDLESETPREIPGGQAVGGYYSDTGYYLTWAPDSQSLVFPTETELKRVSILQGGSPTTICELPKGRRVGGIAWSDDGQTIVFSRYGNGIYEVPARGGPPKLLWNEDHADDITLVETPHGRAVLYAVLNEGFGHRLIVVTPDGQRQIVAPLDANWPELVFSPTGHVLFRRSPTENPSIWALPFSLATLTATGEPFLVERVGSGMSLARNGTFVYLDIGRLRRQVLAWRNREGRILAQASQGHDVIDAPRLSTDGNRAVVSATDAGRSALWLYDAQRLVGTRLDLADELKSLGVLFAFWTRRGDEIHYTVGSTVNEPTTVFTVRANGLAQSRSLASPKGFAVAVDRTADGRYEIVSHRSKQGVMQIGFWPNAEPGQAIDYSHNSVNEHVATLSRNERYIAYTSAVNGGGDVYVGSFPERSVPSQISLGGGVAPRWGPDGTELFFQQGPSLMRVGVSTEGEFSAKFPAAPLFEHTMLRGVPAPFARYDISPDGKRFLTVEAERDLAQPVVRVVENWLSTFQK